MLPKVENMTSSNGNTVPNQFLLTTAEGTYFQSYNSIIAFIPHDVDRWPTKNTPEKRKIKLDTTMWGCSNTTGKYRNIFLGETKKKTQKRIDSGVYLLADLN